MRNILMSVAFLLVTASSALAFPVNPVPEPETLSLVAIGVVAVIFMARRKKK